MKRLKVDMSSSMGVQCFIICWTGKEQNAIEIAKAVHPHVECLTVVYSNDTDHEFSGFGNWVRVPNEEYYGRKVARCLKSFSGQIFLLIHADVSCDDWAGLVNKCVGAFRRDGKVGYWSPEIDGTWFRIENCLLRAPTQDSKLAVVAQNDGIVWAVPEEVAADLASLNYADNNLGWGVDWASLGYCYRRGLIAVRDMSCIVRHPLERGYSRALAVDQMYNFLRQLGLSERLHILFLRRYVWLRSIGARKKALGVFLYFPVKIVAWVFLVQTEMRRRLFRIRTPSRFTTRT